MAEPARRNLGVGGRDRPIKQTLTTNPISDNPATNQPTQPLQPTPITSVTSNRLRNFHSIFRWPWRILVRASYTQNLQQQEVALKVSVVGSLRDVAMKVNFLVHHWFLCLLQIKSIIIHKYILNIICSAVLNRILVKQWRLNRCWALIGIQSDCK